MHVYGYTCGQVVTAVESVMSDLVMLGYRFRRLPSNEIPEWRITLDGVAWARVKIEPRVNGVWLWCQGLSLTPRLTPANPDYAKAPNTSHPFAENLRATIILDLHRLYGDGRAEQEPTEAQSEPPDQTKVEQQPGANDAEAKQTKVNGPTRDTRKKLRLLWEERDTDIASRGATQPFSNAWAALGLYHDTVTRWIPERIRARWQTRVKFTWDEFTESWPVHLKDDYKD